MTGYMGSQMKSKRNAHETTLNEGKSDVREHLPCGIGEIDVRKGEVGATNQRLQRGQEVLYVKHSNLCII